MARLIEILPSEEKIVVHRDCGAKIGYYLNEVQSRTYSDYGGGTDTYYWIICPHCGKEVEVSKR